MRVWGQSVSASVYEVTKEQFGEWRNHPATQFFRQFLKDRAKALGENAHESWLNSPEMFARDSAEARARILELIEIENVSFSQIETFYKEQENATEATVDQKG